jgi:hypothetical protein
MIQDFFTALKIGFREFRTAWRNLKWKRKFDLAGKFSPF